MERSKVEVGRALEHGSKEGTRQSGVSRSARRVDRAQREGQVVQWGLEDAHGLGGEI